jgi:hypothetical protein
MNQKLSWSLLLIGAGVMLYQFSEVLSRHSEWGDFSTPAGVSELLLAAAGTVAALAGALGVQLPRKGE